VGSCRQHRFADLRSHQPLAAVPRSREVRDRILAPSTPPGAAFLGFAPAREPCGHVSWCFPTRTPLACGPGHLFHEHFGKIKAREAHEVDTMPTLEKVSSFFKINRRQSTNHARKSCMDFNALSIQIGFMQYRKAIKIHNLCQKVA
jgi:hypothetical protein